MSGTGRDGRVTKADVVAHAAKQAAAPAKSSPKSASAAPPGPRAEQRVPMTRLRQRIAERLVQAQHTA
ncbi:MAG: dihydrolipoamide succinyltransferase, partial [Gammaproteobacteria bacterium]|nr:dihydrolipoamide succinyltransferase [Gammaproteobacteria bacterium]